MRNDNVKPSYALVLMDETKYYHMREGDERYIKQIFQTYLYDQNEYTYCCELTPSHWLEPVYTSIVFADDTPDDIRDELDSLYCYEGKEGYYMHVSAVKGYVGRNPGNHHVYGEAEDMDEAREYYQGNWVL